MGILRRVAKRILKGGDSTAPARSAPSAPASQVQPADGVGLANIDCDPQELKERLGAGEDIVLVDVRTAEEVAGGTIPHALHIPLDELESRWEAVKNANEVVCYCAGGVRSLKAARFLRSQGVFNATSLEGGLGAWTGIGGATAPLEP